MNNAMTAFRKCLITLVAAAGTLNSVNAADYTIKAGSTDVTVFVTLRPFEGYSLNDLADISYSDGDLSVYYVRDGIAATEIPTATQSISLG